MIHSAGELNDQERALLDAKNGSPKAEGFRLGAECEARLRNAKIPAKHRDLVDCIEVMCEHHAELSSEEIVRRVHNIYTPFTRWERIKRKVRAWLHI